MIVLLPVAMSIFFACYLAFRVGKASEEEVIWTLVFITGALIVASYMVLS